MKIKKKLRDITKEELEKWYKDECIERTSKRLCTNCPFNIVYCSPIVAHPKYFWFDHKEMFSDKFLNQEIEVEVPDILDDVEKRYLSNVIKPFRKKVVCISKFVGSNGNQRIIILVNTFTNQYGYPLIGGSEKIQLPSFEKDKMYKGMTEDRWYTLEELGL